MRASAYQLAPAAVDNLAHQPCAWALTNDIPGQFSSFGGEQAAWGPWS